MFPNLFIKIFRLEGTLTVQRVLTLNLIKFNCRKIFIKAKLGLVSPPPPHYTQPQLYVQLLYVNKFKFSYIYCSLKYIKIFYPTIDFFLLSKCQGNEKRN